MMMVIAIVIVMVIVMVMVMMIRMVNDGMMSECMPNQNMIKESMMN